MILKQELKKLWNFLVNIKMKILFVCKYNRFRSKIAEAFFNKLNKDLKYRAFSAGVFKGIPVSRNLLQISKSLGLSVNVQTHGLTEKMLSDYDIIVIVADNVPASLFSNKIRKRRVIVWKIPDADQNNKKVILEVINKIQSRVEGFVKELKK